MDARPKAKVKKTRTSVGVMLACAPDDPGMPTLTALMTEAFPGEQLGSIFSDGDPVARMIVYRGRCVAERMVRGALKGLMSSLGRHRRRTANRQARGNQPTSQPTNQLTN